MASTNSACALRLAASIEADVSATINSCSGSPSGTISRCNGPWSAAGRSSAGAMPAKAEGATWSMK